MASDPHAQETTSSAGHAFAASSSASGPQASNGDANDGRETHNDSDGMSFFDCSVCLEYATDPVVTQYVPYPTRVAVIIITIFSNAFFS
jgi:hypothetical protein